MPYIKQLIKLGISPFLGIFNNYSNQPAGRCGGNAAENSIQAAWIALRWKKLGGNSPCRRKRCPHTAPARAFSWADQALNRQAAPKRQPY